jgi:hypothetical protein
MTLSVEYFDFRDISARHYSRRIRPLRWALPILAGAFLFLLLIAIVVHGVQPLDLWLGIALVVFLGVGVWTSLTVLVMPPIGIRLTHSSVQAVYANGRERPLYRPEPPGRASGFFSHRIELCDFSTISSSSARLVTSVSPWFVQADMGNVVPVSREALEGLRVYLEARGCRLAYSGQYGSVAGSRIWRYLS